ncbi:hypothetical protein HDU81_008899 [Chytriomyces hyalinus]|nr:hypothetical protein HDU81_008899 [Chytriomyces hyalinus]
MTNPDDHDAFQTNDNTQIHDYDHNEDAIQTEQTVINRRLNWLVALKGQQLTALLFAVQSLIFGALMAMLAAAVPCHVYYLAQQRRADRPFASHLDRTCELPINRFTTFANMVRDDVLDAAVVPRMSVINTIQNSSVEYIPFLSADRAKFLVPMHKGISWLPNLATVATGMDMPFMVSDHSAWDPPADKATFAGGQAPEENGPLKIEFRDSNHRLYLFK